MYLCNTLEIDLFVVGDDKTVLFTFGEGHIRKHFRSILKMDNFSKNVLREKLPFMFNDSELFQFVK